MRDCNPRQQANGYIDDVFRRGVPMGAIYADIDYTDPYDILGTRKGAGDRAVRKAIAKAERGMRKRTEDPGQLEWVLKHTHYQKTLQAIVTLSDPALRDAYDRMGKFDDEGLRLYLARTAISKDLPTDATRQLATARVRLTRQEDPRLRETLPDTRKRVLGFDEVAYILVTGNLVRVCAVTGPIWTIPARTLWDSQHSEAVEIGTAPRGAFRITYSDHDSASTQWTLEVAALESGTDASILEALTQLTTDAILSLD